MPTRPNSSTRPLEEAAALAHLTLPTEPSEVATLDVYVFQAFARVLRLADGIVVLLRAQLSEEALLLGRSLFEDSLRLADLAADPARRPSLLLGWALASMNEANGLGQIAGRAGLDASPEAWLGPIANERARLERYAARNGGIKPKKFRSVPDAAVAHGRAESLWTYALAHEMVHGSDLAFLFSKHHPESGPIRVNLRTVNLRRGRGPCGVGLEDIRRLKAATKDKLILTPRLAKLIAAAQSSSRERQGNLVREVTNAAHRQRIVVAAFLSRDRKVLLAKRAASKSVAPDKWHLPGGHVEFGEDPVQALARELREEFGVETVIGATIHSFSYLLDEVHTVGIVHEAHLVDPAQQLRWDDNEFQACAWVDEGEMAGYLATDDHNFQAAKAGFRQVGGGRRRGSA
jgi:8-oxo-dGTP pyrophosphatase MutT (NUDIX family)